MAKEIVSIGVANEGSINLEVETIKTWTPTNISKIKDIVFFKFSGTFYSMKRDDFSKIFNQ